MRSKLFVPASRPELFAKAMSSAAEAVCFDLEDAVPESLKASARVELQRFLSTTGAAHGKTIIVRVNAHDSPHFEADLEVAVHARVAMLNLPKVQDVADVVAAVAAIERVEQARGLGTPIALLLNIETPAALRRAALLASAHPRVKGLQLGLGDLFEPLGIERREPAAVQQAMFSLRLAAGEAGVFAYDTAFMDLRDGEGFAAEARLASRLGFLGKSCIHPSQVALANAAFMPTAEALAHARRVLGSAAVADAAGLGAYVIDGQTVDRPFIARARSLVEQAHADSGLSE